MITLQLVKGSSHDFVLQINNRDGTPATGLFLDSDTLSTSVWSGEIAVLHPLTTWFSSSNGQIQISFNNADTDSTTPYVPDVYRIQTTATRFGRSSVVLDGQLQLTSAPGVSVLVDLITQEYLQAALSDSRLTDSQIQLLPQLTKAASRLIRKHCNRWFTRRPSADASLSAYDGLYTLDWPSQTLVLRQFPVNGILRVRTNPTQVFNVTNTSGANQQAYVSLSYQRSEADISDVPPQTTGMIFTTIASGVATQQTVLFVNPPSGPNYLTFQDLATKINSLGNGWSAKVQDTKYNLWPTTDLRQGVGPSVAIGNYSQQGFWVHVDDTPAQIDQEAGILKLETIATDPWTSPRFGTYLDTGFGDLDIGGGLNGIRVVYDAGWDTVPEDIQEACVEVVQDLLNLLNLDQRLQSESDGSYSYSLAKLDGYALTPSVRGKIGYYRNIRS